jgi:hypothetical protein
MKPCVDKNHWSPPLKKILIASGFLIAAALPAAACGTYEQQLAHNHTKQHVKAQLRSPSRANFPFQPTQKVLEGGGSSCTVTLRSWVEAPNAFGTVVRSNYVAEVKIVGRQVSIEAFGFVD